MKHTTTIAETKTAQSVLPIMHWWFLVDMGLVSIAGIQLFLLSELTDRFFAWTIGSALTAAFIGAAYWSTLPMLFTAFRARDWAKARVAVPGVWLFSTLTLIATLLHWDKFHWNSPIFTAQFAFWAWLAIYIIVPVGLGIAWYVQQRVPGVEPARRSEMPGWFRTILGIQAAIGLLLGAGLYLFPNSMISVWIWALTPLTGAAIGAWFIGVSATLVWAIWENDWQRLRGSMLTFALFGVLQLIALARYAGEMNWNSLTAWLYVAFLASAVVAGGLGTLFARRQDDSSL